MNARVTAVLAALIILALGLLGLLYPERVMGFLGFAILNAAHSAAALGEVRATYGGIFVVMGLYALHAAIDPVAYRPRLRFIGFLWLGACAARLFGVWVDGNPGLPGWAAVVFELMVGGSLVLAALSARAPIAEVPVTTVPVAAPPA